MVTKVLLPSNLLHTSGYTVLNRNEKLPIKVVIK
eukprot:06683.XXX_298737_298838_1 [CDS] Oithona nana genome sequencing.